MGFSIAMTDGTGCPSGDWGDKVDRCTRAVPIHVSTNVSYHLAIYSTYLGAHMYSTVLRGRLSNNTCTAMIRHEKTEIYPTGISSNKQIRNWYQTGSLTRKNSHSKWSFQSDPLNAAPPLSSWEEPNSAGLNPFFLFKVLVVGKRSSSFRNTHVSRYLFYW